MRHPDSLCKGSQHRLAGRCVKALPPPAHIVHIEVENTSGTFTTFEPRHFSVVDKNQLQADILGLYKQNEIYPAESRRIAAKATIKAQYILTEKVDLSARIYYDDKMLGAIRE